MRKVFVSCLLLLFGFSSSTCKKISTYPLDLYGKWTCDHESCTYVLLEINKNDEGTYGNGCGDSFGGKIRYTANSLYIKGIRYKFINKPETLADTDSLYLNYKGNKTRTYMKMTLEEKKSNGGNTYTLYKIENY